MKLENYTPNFEADPDQIQDSLGVSDYVLDAFGSIPAGLEDLAHGVYNLGDFLSFDVLPDWDEERFFQRPKTLAGDLTAALVQYAVPFGFIGKGLSKAGKLAKVFTKGKKPGSVFDLKPQGFVAADVATNFIAFDGQQERLSNLLKEVDNPAFNNAVTQYLAADPDDAELEGRMKNVLEGAMIDAGVGALFKLFSVTLKASKRFTKEVAGGANKEDAATTAMMQYQDDAKGLNIVGDIDSQMQFAKDRAETDELYRMVGGDPEDIPEVDLRTINWDEVDLEEAVDVAPAVAREELEAIEAGGRLVDEVETATAIVKTYEMPGGSTKTIMVDKANPERVFDFSPQFTADLDTKFGVKSDVGQQFKEQTLIENVGKRTQTENAVTAREALQDLSERTGGDLGEFTPVLKRLLELGEDTGIGARIELRGFASNLPEGLPSGSFYESGRRRIVLDANGRIFNNNPVYTLLHEATHAVTVDNVVKYFDANAFNKIDINDIGARAAAIDEVLKRADLPKPIADMFRMFKAVDGMRDDIVKAGAGSDLNWIKNPAEFMSMAFADPALQKALKGPKYKRIWESIKNFVRKLLGREVTPDLADKLISTVGEITQMRLPTRRGRGVDLLPDQPIRRGNLDETVQKMVKDADTSSLKIGGEQAVKGLARQAGKLPEGLQVDGLAQLLDAVSDEILKDGKMMNVLSEQGLEDGVIMELANLLGADGKYMNGLIKAAENDRVTLRRIMSRMAGLKKLALDNGQEIINTAKNYKQGAAKMMPEEREIMEARLKGLLEQQLHIQAGHSGLASGFGRGLKSTQMGSKITLSEAELKNAQLRQEYLSKKGGMTMDQIVEGILIAEQNGGDDLFAAVIGLNKQVRGSAGGKMLDMVQEYYKNALMWGPRTLTVNYMGTGIAHVLKNFERSIGGWLSSDPAVKQAVANQWGESLSLIESSHFLLKAWQTGGQFIGDAGSAFVEGTGSSIGSITGKNVQQVLGNELSDGMKLAIDYFGNAVRLPNRFNQSVDQWYKFLQYKGRSLAQLKLKAYELGLREPKEIAEYAHDAFEALVTRSNRNFSEQALFREADELIQGPFQTPADKSKAVADYVQGERANRLEKARQAGLVDENLDDNAAMMQLTKDYIDPNIRAAEEVTFSGELGPLGAAVQNLVTKSKIGFLVAPFVRTPTNILKFSFDRLLAPHRLGLNKLRATEAWAKLEPGYKATIDALESGGIKGMENARKSILEQMRAVKADGTPDELVRAEARGKVAFGTMLNSALFSAVYMFGDRINGGGPEDFKQRQAWLNAGNLPYSIKMPGTETWVSYQRLDPLATMIGVFADIKDLAEDNKLNGVNESSLEHLMSVLFFTGVRNFTNKSYLSGVDQTLSMLKGQTPVGKYAGGMTAAFLPNILAQGQSITGDQELKEIRGFADIILKKIPGVTMDLKRTPLGEPVVQEYFDGVAGILNPLNPIAFGFDNKDIAAKELGNVGHGFSMPSTKLRGVIELTDYTGPNGRSAYDRWLELSSQVKLNGMTMKQALTKLIKDKRYQALDPKSFTGIPSPRVKYLTRIISRYRKAAQFQMLEEFPEIAELNRNVAAGIRSGVPREDVLELLPQ